MKVRYAALEILFKNKAATRHEPSKSVLAPIHDPKHKTTILQNKKKTAKVYLNYNVIVEKLFVIISPISKLSFI